MPSIKSFHNSIATTIGLVVILVKALPYHCFASFHLWGVSTTRTTGIGHHHRTDSIPSKPLHYFHHPPQKNYNNDKDVDVDLNVEDNPTIDPNRVSLSQVRYGDVMEALEFIYPKQDLSKRNAISRKDGYWQFIESGQEQPTFLTDGEFDILFFAELLDRAHDHYYYYDDDGANTTGHHDGGEQDQQDCCSSSSDWSGKTFLDIGSGTGRLVLGAAALLHPGLKL